ncbi:MAG: hypothetical protein AB199_04120 [Parcubacteria bacterium C7867-004]|nr:MAG: hypothetical protein AB199_04120 [Parcubacteria bacterium C7867-004]
MRLLVVTQVVDSKDSVLGAYHAWLRELAKHFEHIEVVCLFEGEHALPENVQVHSLGKEKAVSPSYVYAFRFMRFAWSLRNQYDSVLVHMNQEYILLAGVLWKFLGKPIYLWRNHFAGSWLTDVAAAFCTKVYCTSKHSYTAKYRKTELMPVGVNLERFTQTASVRREPKSILFLARIAPSKRPDVLIEALGILLAKGVSFVASVYGSALPADAAYLENLKSRVEILGLHDRVRFYPSVPNEKTPEVFQAHELFVNCSPSGMFDKTLFEAAASGCLVLAASEDWRDHAGEAAWFDGTSEGLADRLSEVLTTSEAFEAAEAESHSLASLGSALAASIGASGQL